MQKHLTKMFCIDHRCILACSKKHNRASLMIICLMVWSLLYQSQIIPWTDTTTMETLSLRYGRISEFPSVPCLSLVWPPVLFWAAAAAAAPADSQSPAGRPAEAAGGEQSHHRNINPVFPRTCSDQVVLLCCSRGWWVTESLRREEPHKSRSWDTVSVKMWVKHVDPKWFWSVLP